MFWHVPLIFVHLQYGPQDLLSGTNLTNRNISYCNAYKLIETHFIFICKSVVCHIHSIYIMAMYVYSTLGTTWWPISDIHFTSKCNRFIFSMQIKPIIVNNVNGPVSNIPWGKLVQKCCNMTCTNGSTITSCKVI